jgi:hypothetical protein
VNAGNWIREHRGIYRLADFPAAERPDLMLWYLWSQNRGEVSEGTYSQDTALSLHELSELMPSKLHMTVPKTFRRTSAIPEILILHRANLNPNDVLSDSKSLQLIQLVQLALLLPETLQPFRHPMQRVACILSTKGNRKRPQLVLNNRHAHQEQA